MKKNILLLITRVKMLKLIIEMKVLIISLKILSIGFCLNIIYLLKMLKMILISFSQNIQILYIIRNLKI